MATSKFFWLSLSWYMSLSMLCRKCVAASPPFGGSPVHALECLDEIGPQRAEVRG